MEAGTTTAPVALFKKRGNKSKATIRKRPATPPPANDDSDDFSSSEDESGQRVKRRKKSSAITATSKSLSNGAEGLKATSYRANRDVPITDSNDATKQSNWFDENAKDALSKKNLLGSSRTQPASTQPDGTYKGLANQTSFIQRNPDAPQRSVGPIKAPTNIRTITVTDFAPDVCKEYVIPSNARSVLADTDNSIVTRRPDFADSGTTGKCLAFSQAGRPSLLCMTLADLNAF